MQSPLAYSHGSCLLSPISVSTRTIALVVRELDPNRFLAMNKMCRLPYSVIAVHFVNSVNSVIALVVREFDPNRFLAMNKMC
jgi:hypothetical protein